MRVRWMAMVAAGWLGWCASARAEVQYTITALDTTSAYSAALGINREGQIVGVRSLTADGYRHGFLYTGGVITDLETLGDDESTPVSMNDNGTVVGWTERVIPGVPPTPDIIVDTAFVWQNGMMQRIDGIGANSHASGINNQGEIVGYHQAGGNARAFLYISGLVQDLPTLSSGVFNVATRNNATGQIVGYSAIDNPSGPLPTLHAFLYSARIMQDLGAPARFDSRALDINDAGQVTGVIEGRIQVAPGRTEDVSYGVLWNDGAMLEIGSLSPGGQSIPNAINDLAQIVGSAERAPSVFAPFLWQDGAMSDLNDLVPAGSAWELLSADDINDRGQIVGVGVYQGLERAYLLTPVPEPAGMLPIAAGLLIACYAFGRRTAVRNQMHRRSTCMNARTI